MTNEKRTYKPKRLDCDNCGLKNQTVEIPYGTARENFPCPNCGVKRLVLPSSGVTQKRT